MPSQPHQYEFARLNLTYTVLSKRVLTLLVRDGHVKGWDDPRMPTLAGLRRRGVPPAAIRDFVKRIGVAKANSVVDVGMFEFSVREALNKSALRRMAVLKPLKVVIENYPEGQVEELDAVNHPDDPAAGSRKIKFARELFIEQDDFMENPPKKFFRLSPGVEVRLRYAYFITCKEVKKNAKGEVIELRCSYDPATKGGNAPDGRKVKATIHWVSAAHAVPAEVRLYNPLFGKARPGRAEFRRRSQPEFAGSLGRRAARAGARPKAGAEPVQFERNGYFCPDPDSAPGKLVFNRTIGLRDTFAKEVAKRVNVHNRSPSHNPIQPSIGPRIAGVGGACGTQRRQSNARESFVGQGWAAGIDAARRRAGLALPEGLSAPADELPAAAVAMGAGRSRARPAAALAAGRLRLRHRRLFRGRPRAGLVGGARRRARRPHDRGGCAPPAVWFSARAGVRRDRPGFATATLQTARIAHPVLAYSDLERAGRGLRRGARGARAQRPYRGARRNHDAPRIGEAPERVRVAVRKGTAPAVGSFVAFKAHLSPPLQPLRPGGYDFARDMYFQRIGASGYVLGKIRPAPAPSAPGLRLRVVAVDRRHARDDQPAHSCACLPGDRGSIASALITGKRGAISDAGRRRLLCVEPGARAGDLRLPHGGGGRHRVLLHPRRPCARSRRWPPASRSRNGPPPARWRPRPIISCCRAPASPRNAPSS